MKTEDMMGLRTRDEEEGREGGGGGEIRDEEGMIM